MATSTPNLDLTLPVGTENVSRQIINENNTKIDTAFGELDAEVSGKLDASTYGLTKLYTKASDFPDSAGISDTSSLLDIFNAMDNQSILFMSPGNSGFGDYSTLGVKCNGVVMLFKHIAARNFGFNVYGTATNGDSERFHYFRIYQSGSTYDSILWSNSLGNLFVDLAIVSKDGNAPKAISRGQYVLVDGTLRVATTNIAAGTALSTSTNIAAVSDGGFNHLKSLLDAVQTIDTAFSGDIDTLKTPGIVYLQQATSTSESSIGSLYGTLYIAANSRYNWGDRATQLFIGSTGNVIWYRRYQGEWKPKVDIATANGMTMLKYNNSGSTPGNDVFFNSAKNEAFMTGIVQADTSDGFPVTGTYDCFQFRYSSNYAVQGFFHPSEVPYFRKLYSGAWQTPTPLGLKFYHVSGNTNQYGNIRLDNISGIGSITAVVAAVVKSTNGSATQISWSSNGTGVGLHVISAVNDSIIASTAVEIDVYYF